MVWIKGHYEGNHPKDRIARKRRDVGAWMKDNLCTKRELRDATERNVQKCMRDMKSHAGDEWKKASKYLGEDTNWEKHRRSR